jgi:hypothetical protein
VGGKKEMGRATKGKSFEIVDPDSVVDGYTVAQWTEEWWKWAVSSPAENNPVFADETGEYAHLNNDNESVFFIAGAAPVADGEVIERNFFVPSDKFVLLPVLNVLSYNTNEHNTEDLPYDPLEPYIEIFKGLYATIDGKEIPNIEEDYLVTQAPFEIGPAEEGSQLEQLLLGEGRDPKNVYEDSGSTGYWLMLGDLSNGRHTLEFGGYVDFNLNEVFDEGDLSLAVKININVVPEVAAEHSNKQFYPSAPYDGAFPTDELAAMDTLDSLLV